MPRTIDFIFDFGSPNAYLAYTPLQKLASRTGATINVIPCLLGGIFKATGNQAPMMAFGGVRGKMEYDRLEIARFIKKHALDKFRFNPNFPVNTLLMMRGAIVAQRDNQLTPYLEAGLRAMWEEGLKMDDPDIYIEAITLSGLDGSELLARTQEPEIKRELVDNTNAAVARGAFGVPTFFVGQDIFFGKERLGQIEDMIATSS